MKTAELALGLALGGIGRYFVGRWHKAIQHWQHSYHKLKRDRRDVWRGPRW